jgi:hypothetical protein
MESPACAAAIIIIIIILHSSHKTRYAQRNWETDLQKPTQISVKLWGKYLRAAQFNIHDIAWDA